MAVFTHDAVTRKESLKDILRDISPSTDNYLVTNLEDSEAKNTLHEWPTFNLARPTSASPSAEGADFVDSNNFAPLRSQNIVEIIVEGVRVSGTAQKAAVAGVKNLMAFNKKMALRQLKAKMEFRILNAGAKVSGASGTARQMNGLIGVISTSVTARASGTSMFVNELEDILQDSWTQVGQEYVADIVLTTMAIKRKIATFTGRVTHNVDSTQRIYNNVSYYEGSSGTVKIIPHKDVINSSGSTHLFALREDTYKIAYFREPEYQVMGKDGDADKGQYVVEYTLESLAQRASVLRIGYNQNG